jgi:hypothetical protein
MGVQYTMAEKLEEDRLKIQKQQVDTRSMAVQGLLIIMGMAVVLTAIVFFFRTVSDSDLVDAMEECGMLHLSVEDRNNVKTFDVAPVNAMIDSCRKQAFDFYKGAKP